MKKDFALILGFVLFVIVVVFWCKINTKFIVIIERQVNF